MTIVFCMTMFLVSLKIAFSDFGCCVRAICNELIPEKFKSRLMYGIITSFPTLVITLIIYGLASLTATLFPLF